MPDGRCLRVRCRRLSLVYRSVRELTRRFSGRRAQMGGDRARRELCLSVQLIIGNEGIAWTGFIAVSGGDCGGFVVCYAGHSGGRPTGDEQSGWHCYWTRWFSRQERRHTGFYVKPGRHAPGPLPGNAVGEFRMERKPAGAVADCDRFPRPACRSEQKFRRRQNSHGQTQPRGKRSLGVSS